MNNTNTLAQILKDAVEIVPTDSKQSCIYVLTEPDGERVRYVGMAQNPAIRLAAHLQCRKGEEHFPKQQWITSLKKAGKLPRMFVIERVALEDAPRRERYWIMAFRGIEQADCNTFRDTSEQQYEKSRQQYLKEKTIRHSLIKPQG